MELEKIEGEEDNCQERLDDAVQHRSDQAQQTTPGNNLFYKKFNNKWINKNNDNDIKQLIFRYSSTLPRRDNNNDNSDRTSYCT